MKRLVFIFFMLCLCGVSVRAQSDADIPSELKALYPEGIKKIKGSERDVVLAAQKQFKWGLIDYNGMVILSFEFDNIHSCDWAWEGGEIWLVAAQKNGKWGIVDLEGRILRPFSAKKPLFLDAKKQKSLVSKVKKKYDFTVCRTKVQNCKTAKTAYLNRLEEQKKIAAQRRRVTPICMDDKWGFISEENPNPVFEYDSCEKLTESIFLVSKNGKYGTVNADGAKIINPIEYDILKLSDYFLLMKKDKFGVMDRKTGRIVLSCIYDNILEVENVSSRLFYLVKNEKWGLGNLKGELCGCKYDFIDKFVGKEAAYHYKGYVGKIGTNGKETLSAVKTVFERAYSMSDSRAAEKMQVYQEVLELDKELNAGYAGVCLNNMGVLYENAGDRNAALSYYAQGMAAGNQKAAANYKQLRGQIRAEKWNAVANALGQMSESLTATANQYSGTSGGSYSGGSNLRSSSSNNTGSHVNHPGMSQSQLQSRYNAAIDNIKRIQDSWATHVGTHGEVVQRNNLRSVKQNIQSIKSSAQRHGITLQLSALENWNP